MFHVVFLSPAGTVESCTGLSAMSAARLAHSSRVARVHSHHRIPTWVVQAVFIVALHLTRPRAARS